MTNITIMKPTVSFIYDEKLRAFDVFVTGCISSSEALECFNAVILTSRQATPKLNYNKAEHIPALDELGDLTFKISVGI